MSSRGRIGRALVLVALVGALAPAVRAATSSVDSLPPPPTPDLQCGPGDAPEQTQGRAPAADYQPDANGHVRAADGYRCNATQVGTAAASGGYRVFRYVDAKGTVCAFYDTTLLFPTNAANINQMPHTGVWVLDMSDPTHPLHTDTLRTPAMQTPHESLSLNQERGLLGAVMANPVFYPGQFDLYDVSQDCTHPVLKSTLPTGILGHEGTFSADGNTYYAASLSGKTLTAIDVSNLLVPKILWSTSDFTVHGLNSSSDSKTVYFADNGTSQGSKGLTVLDVSHVTGTLQAHVPVISHLTWRTVSTPQTDLPITIKGRPFLVEVDEFGTAPTVGAARIIDIGDPAHPKVVSNMRLAVNNTTDYDSTDPGASSSLQGYNAHYCGVPSRTDPYIVACSFIASGLRVFDIRNPYHPVEIAYFNMPKIPNAAQGGAYAMSQPAFDVARKQIWYSDGNSGLYVVQIHTKIPFLRNAASGAF